MNSEQIQVAIIAFKKRMETELDYCNELFHNSTIRLLAAKYDYYVLCRNETWMSDIGYDMTEQGWYVMGRALGLLEPDETSPCVGFDNNHPLAQQGKELCLKFTKRRR